jgi:hypothetical protein
MLRSEDVHAPKGESHGVSAMVTKALVPQSSVSRRGTNTFVSKEGNVFTGKKDSEGEEDCCAWRGRGCHVGRWQRVVRWQGNKAYVVSVPEMLLRDDAWGTTFGHIRRVGSPNSKLTGVAIFIPVNWWSSTSP